MRFSAVAVLCAAPMALASTLQAELVARGAVGGEASESSATKESGNSNSQKSNQKADNSGQILVEQSSTEIILIWANAGGGAATSTVTDTITVTQAGAGATGGASVGAAAAAQTTHAVTVGGSAGLVYTPESINAAVGDMVVFTFLSANHTVTQSAFDTPCKKLAEGMDTGFVPNTNNSIVPAPQMGMQVTVSTPIWFYCRQSGHCGKGMTFSINPTANKTQAEFKQQAIAQNGTGAASPITGGTAAPAAPAAVASEAPAAAPPAASAAGGTGQVSGAGTIVGGACECSCLCGTASFPQAAVQGLNAFGGMSGAMPLAALPA